MPRAVTLLGGFPENTPDHALEALPPEVAGAARGVRPPAFASSLACESLTTEKELRDARDPGFCYLCGQNWREDDIGKGKRDRDHVPPRAIFGTEHRTPPLVLRTHPRCNNGQSEYDEQIA